MEEKRKNVHIYLSLIVIALSIVSIILAKPKTPTLSYGANVSFKWNSQTGLQSTPTPTVFDPFPYSPPKIPVSRAYRIMLVGDSMVDALGLNANLLRQHLIEYYPEHEFVNYNYGFGATSIETLPERLENQTLYNGASFPAILSQGFDLIIIESFAYNPLSQNEVGQGLEKHKKILDDSIRQIISKRPEVVVAIMATIAPSKTHFAKGVYELSPEERTRWAEERIAYIESTVAYAKENNIPLINVYEKSLNSDGSGNLIYINPDDYIHPSVEGIDLISKTIAEFIYTKKIFPE